ncbi:antibiotic biosynthesis monooxygenase [Streptomyces sp. NPDC051907]|uniref:antibiotic biosynthesis monooxygenase n=1 Tax=Streptomyces sp. NPDC051907 TaxID=3155284 RepID=UPI00342784FA
MTVVAHPDSRPDLARSGVGVVKASTWRVGTPERQRATVDAVAKVWQSREWPFSGLLSYSVYIGSDGDTLLHYSQWESEEAYAYFFEHLREDRNDEIDALVPGIERVGLFAYDLYRSRAMGGAHGPADPRTPGAVVIVDVEFEGPDAQRQRDWVDGVVEALETDPQPHPGGISAHFHIGRDGVRVLNYAEWESEEAHIEALAAAGEGVGSPTPQWARVRDFPGVAGGGVQRYTPALSLSAGV